MKKALIVATTASMIDQFNMDNIRILQDLNYEVHVACNFAQGNTCNENRISDFKIILQDMNVLFFQVDFGRDIYNLKQHLQSYKQIKNIISKGEYDLIHCHTPICSALSRFAAKKARKNGTKVIYTAHGFHFYKGAPRKNWLLFYPVEKVCAHFTDVLITINKEDFTLAQKSIRADKVCYIPGVGIDLNEFGSSTIERSQKRSEIGVPENAFLLFSTGELNWNKNHQVVVRALSKLNRKDVHYAIAGQGDQYDNLLALSEELGVSDQLHLLGFRSDMSDLYNCADIFIFPSFREGLSVSLMEAMSCGLPIVCSNIRGNMDLVEEGLGGYLVEPHNLAAFSEKIKLLLGDEILRAEFGSFNRENIKKCDIKNVNQMMENIYLDRFIV